MADALSKKRRQVYLLTRQDSKEHPVWEFCSGEEEEEDQDEATVRPAQRQDVQGYGPGACVIAADAIFADGSTGAGYVYSGAPDDFGCTQPNIFVAEKQVGFWLGSLRFAGNVQQIVDKTYRLLGKDAQSTFPVEFRSTVPMNDVFITSSVKGFMAVEESGSTRLFR